ncbi:prenyltransferase [Streptomonospora sp. S1-112]|uniref:Prenyltransferase n=1 Tax=Streptomonospora mangrovi TaxID=2883123 RepID=A0A9X3NS87_9ACTN|nr:prenyltransferase [Streptomonospora mangrovi]MDA0567408.1 prenyltransferase [Streptomonospora mangrovi]
MSMVTSEALRSAEHFIWRNARLIDRHRFAFHFRSGPAGPVRSALESYRNVDGGYGNGLEPDLRGHGSQPLAAATALGYLDELGPIPRDVGADLCRYLTSVTHANGGVPCVLPSARHTEAAPWWREGADHSGALYPTATIVGLLHRHHLCHAWRDRATAFCWTRIGALRWTEPDQAIAVCTFLQHVPDRPRAEAEFTRLAPAIRAGIATDPAATGHVHKPLDLAPQPGHIARRLFTDDEIAAHLDALVADQRPDGGWDITWPAWAEAARNEWRGILTVHRLLTLRAYGRIAEEVPAPLRVG